MPSLEVLAPSSPAPAAIPDLTAPSNSVAASASALSPDPAVFLTSDKLLLPDVPEHARESVRAFLSPFVSSIPLKNGDCWNIAQRMMLAANSPRVGYVEGVWSRPEHDAEHQRGECDCEEYQKIQGAPHAWNTVDGFLVDLVVEFKFIGWTQEDEYWSPDDWWHEPLKAYSFDDFEKYEFTRAWYKKYVKKNAPKRVRRELLKSLKEGFSITPMICFLGWGDGFGMTFTEEDQLAMANDEGYVFKPANDRFVTRLNAWLQQQAVPEGTVKRLGNGTEAAA